MNRSIFQCTHWTSRVLSFTFQCCCSQLYSHVVLASSYISKENELMMYLHCKMIDLKDLNIVYRCQNQHCSSYSSCLLVKFINWRCVLLTERKSVRPFFFHFRETDRHHQWHSQWNNLWAVRFTNTEGSHSVCFWWSISPKGYQTEV